MKERVEIQVNDKLKIAKEDRNFVVVKLEENEVVVNKDTKETIKSSKWVDKEWYSLRRLDQVFIGLLKYVEVEEQYTICSYLDRYNEMIQHLSSMANEIMEKLND